MAVVRQPLLVPIHSAFRGWANASRFWQRSSLIVRPRRLGLFCQGLVRSEMSPDWWPSLSSFMKESTFGSLFFAADVLWGSDVGE